MKKFFAPNINATGRIIRATLGFLCVLGGVIGWKQNVWASVALLVAGAFMLFEAARGWCVMRACGVKTRH